MPANLHLRLGISNPSQSVPIENAVIAGWTGRDSDAVEKHIRELEALGVKRPSTTPIFYRVGASRLTTDPVIQSTGNASSGEVEFVLLQLGGKLWVGVGSDHTDREVEAYDVTVSKQMCDKPIADQFWDFSDVAAHWDRLQLRAFIEEAGKRVPYQEGPVTAMREPADLIAKYTGADKLAEATAMFCGTIAAIGGVRPSPVFEIELHDPVLNRTITHKYATETIPRVS